MSTPDSNKLVNGLLFEQTVEFLREQKGDEAVSELENNFDLLLFDRFRMYPVDQLIALQKEVVTQVFGKESEQGYHTLGVHAYNSFVKTLVGATLTNIATSPIPILEKIQDAWSSIVNFGNRKLLEADEKKGHAVLLISDDPRNPYYLQGVLDAGLQAIHAIRPATKIVSQDHNSYKIEINWQPQ